ncbi:hypothetical protein [Microbacterium sp. NPDC058345]|uniref:hypothetical protein n=1 Tax=Microbacterium sp. NPDC058345 TaxID=3346455 RepID=UPI00365FA7DA
MIDSSSGPATTRRLLSFAIGAGGGILGLLPWVVGGARLPLQNLWVATTMPEDMPLAVLPLSQYHATTLFSLVLLGGAFAGLAVRFARRGRALSAWPAGMGVAVVHIVAAIQSFSVLADGLGLGGGADDRAQLYVVGMLGGTLAAMLLAQLALWMTSRPTVDVASLGVALAAVPFASWFSRWVVAFTGEVMPPAFLPFAAHWLPSVVVGAALVWCGVRPTGRLVVWAVSLLALWIVPALFTAIQYGLGMRVLQGDVAEMAAAAADVFPLALREIWMPPVVALVIAVAGTVVRVVVERGEEKPEEVRVEATSAGA